VSCFGLSYLVTNTKTLYAVGLCLGFYFGVAHGFGVGFGFVLSRFPLFFHTKSELLVNPPIESE
jgi:hypothetical protein